ncbi:hypothetical protein GMOD_00010019 [Pyrenophora seminiperda CCB06]|uniref:Uncharacterized protein n=1 Tax=Pyrenophora seminiperda CCB06 TaxID=1302712 RepID=A0A3M7M1Q1_9PLEO|nr:hypothetical protein GMOD_00010019 [Pyrenophora seminiperda CCB06]
MFDTPAPHSLAGLVVKHSRSPDSMHFPATESEPAENYTLVTYSSRNQDSGNEDHLVTGCAGPAGTLDEDGEPFPLSAEEAAQFKEANERHRRIMVKLNGLSYPDCQPYYNYTDHVSAEPESDMKKAKDAGKMAKTKAVNQRIYEEQCIEGVTQQYMDDVASLRLRAIAEGWVFPEGVDGWNDISEAEQIRIRYATRANEDKEHRETLAAAASVGTDTAAARNKALAEKFEGETYAKLIQTLATSKLQAELHGQHWPEGINGWTDWYTDRERELILEVAQYLELQEAIETSMGKRSPNLAARVSSDDELL